MVMVMLDSTSAPTTTPPGKKGGQDLGRSRGGLTTKIHLVTDEGGNSLDFALTAGPIHDSSQAEGLLLHYQFKGVLADRAYDSDRLPTFIR